jgi:hypothetical protein
MESEIETLKKKLEIALDFIWLIEYTGDKFSETAAETLKKIEEMEKP